MLKKGLVHPPNSIAVKLKALRPRHLPPPRRVCSTTAYPLSPPSQSRRCPSPTRSPPGPHSLRRATAAMVTTISSQAIPWWRPGTCSGPRPVRLRQPAWSGTPWTTRARCRPISGGSPARLASSPPPACQGSPAGSGRGLGRRSAMKG